MYAQLQKGRHRWGRVSTILARVGANPRVSGLFYKTIVMSVVLYGCETWVITPTMHKVLEGFHNRVARRLAGLQGQRLRNGEWFYPPIEDALEATSMFPMEHYISKRCNRVADEVATRPIYDICTSQEVPPGSSHRRRWWWDLTEG